MQKIKPKNKNKSNYTAVNLSNERRRDVHKKSKKPRFVIKDTKQAIKEAANGCWWIEQYLRASYSWRDTARYGIDDAY